MGLVATVPLDDRENIFAKVDDLSRDLIIEYLREVKSDLVKEALVNAVYHRGYDVRGPVEVSITREELTVVS